MRPPDPSSDIASTGASAAESLTLGSAASPRPTPPVRPVNELPEVGPPTTNLSIPAVALAIGAHPDDIEFGCGATLAKWSRAGCAVHHLVLTDGSKGSWDPGMDTAQLAAVRMHEATEAAGLLGSQSVEFLGRTDGELRNGPEERRAVCRAIRRIRPDVVLSHDPWRRYRLHPDHRNAGFIVTDAIVAAGDPLFFPEEGLTPHRPAILLLWEADVPNHVESVRGFEQLKLAALLAHRSQHRNAMGIGAETTETDFSRQLIAQLERHGAIAGVSRGESFHALTL